ncbi:MAG TPA: toll/interleukin-1 receptor domain-containing protein, partial [Myxococcales bacterium]|nr:toll/interleukin-1 receptor domain-containing protein [Myxococcales bacterium]
METGATEYDVFLCHSSQDKAQVRILARELRARGLRVFLDEDEIIPGHPWQEVLEQAIQQSRSVAVVCGPSGIGPWAAHEIRASLDDLTRRGAPIIPVLLPDSPVASELPLFL